MPRVGFEPTIPVFERAKTVHALDHATTVLSRTGGIDPRILDLGTRMVSGQLHAVAPLPLGKKPSLPIG
jgi:hypothetical protein